MYTISQHLITSSLFPKMISPVVSDPVSCSLNSEGIVLLHLEMPKWCFSDCSMDILGWIVKVIEIPLVKKSLFSSKGFITFLELLFTFLYLSSQQLCMFFYISLSLFFWVGFSAFLTQTLFHLQHVCYKIATYTE